MKINLCNNLLSFTGMPRNYMTIDKHLSRSAQPMKEDLAWLKEQGVTDIINFRTMYKPNIDFDEEKEVLKLGMNYHNIPSITKTPKEDAIKYFLNLVEQITQKGGKTHIHCKAGADRTGMYSFIYKAIKGIGTMAENESEWLKRGHNTRLYPDLRNWTKEFIKTLKV